MIEKTRCAEALALVAFFSTMPIYSPNVVPLQQCLQDDAAMSHFVMPMLVSATVASIGLFIRAATSATRFERVFSAYSLAAPFGYVLCMAYFVLASTGAVSIQAAPLAFCGIVIGLCLPCVALRWGERLISLRLQQALLLVCAVCGSTAAINWAFSLLSPAPLAAASIVMAAIGSFFPYASRAISRFGRANADEAEKGGAVATVAVRSRGNGNSTALDGTQTELPLIPRFVSVLVPALVGLSVFAFHMGVSRESIVDSVSTEVLGNIIASLILAPLCFVKSRRPTSVLLFSCVAPLAATVLLAYMSVANDLGMQIHFISTGIYTFFCLIAQISLALGIAGTHAREFSAPMIWSGLLAIFSAFSIAGLSLGAFLSGERPFMPQAITALYCAYLIIQSVRSLWKNDTAGREDTAPADEEQGYARRCEKLADEFSLSPREREIAVYLGRGHTCSYIAKTLVISESTVYTHARNIYRKVGIQSKEDLIQILADRPKPLQG